MDKAKSKVRKKSIIVSLFNMLGDKVRAAISNSAIGHFFSSYDKVDASFESSVTYTGAQKLLHIRALSNGRNAVATAFDKSRVRQGVLSLTSAIRHATLRFWGVFMLTFSLYVVLMYLIRKFGMFYTASISYLVVSAVLFLLSLPLLFDKRTTLGRAFLDSRFFSWLLFDFFELRYENFREKANKNDKISVAFILGMLFGCLTFFVSPTVILLAFGALIYFYMSLVSPEAALLVSLFSLPLLSFFEHPTFALCALVLCIFLGYLFKVLRKKRLFRFGVLELLVVLFSLCVLFGGMRNASMTKSTQSLVMVLLACGFFLVSNLLRTKEMILHAARALALSSVICAAVGIAECILGMSTLDWLDLEMFSSIKGRAVSLFENPNVLGTYLCIGAPLTLSVMSMSKEVKKTRWFIGFCAVIACAVLTWSRGAWIGIIVSILVLLATTRHFLVTVFSIVLCLPFAGYIIPQSIAERFFSIGNLADTSTAYRLNIWRGCVDMAGEYGFGGIGIGDEAFACMYARFAVSGAETAYHSHSLWLQIFLTLGVCGFIIFAVMIFFFVQRAFTALKYGVDRDMQGLLAAGFSGVLGVLVCGIFDYSWYNYRVYFMFFAVMGLVCACDRACRDTEGGLYE